MFRTVIEDFLKEKKVYILIDCGWYSARDIQLFENEKEAITKWEKITGFSYNKYQEYIKLADCSGEGHWYYSLEIISLWDIFQQELIDQKGETVYKEAEKIKTLGNKMISVATRREVEKEFAQALNGAIYYLTKTTNYSPAIWNEERKKDFEEGLKKI